MICCNNQASFYKSDFNFWQRHIFYLYNCTMKNKSVFSIAIIFLSVVLINIFLWFYVCSKPAKTFYETRDNYLFYFPGFLQHAMLLTVINIVLLSIAAFIFNKSRKLLKVSNVLFYVCVVLISWQVFTLM